MDQRQSASEQCTWNNGGSNSGVQDNLAERLALLEKRIRFPTSAEPSQPKGQYSQDPTHPLSAGEESILTTLESPAISQHSFHFDPPSNGGDTTNPMMESLVSPQASTNSSSGGGRQSSSLEAVNRAAEQHMQRIAALENSRSNSFSNASFQTIKTSHTVAVTNDNNRVVKESPPLVMSSRTNQSSSGRGDPRALNVNSGNVVNQPSKTNTKRKSTPSKKDVSASSRQRKQAPHNNNNNNNKGSDGTRKRTRLHFSGTENNDQAAKLPSTVTTATNSNSSRSPKTQKTSSTATKSKNRLIDDFFTIVRTAAGSGSSGGKGAGKEPKKITNPKSATDVTTNTTRVQVAAMSPSKQVAQLQQSCQHWEQLCQEKEAQLKAVASSRSVMHSAIQGALKQKEAELATVKESYSSYSKKVSTVLEDLMRQQALTEAQHVREKIAADTLRLGRVVYTRAGMRSVEAWEDGSASRQLKQRKETLLEEQAKLQERKAQAEAAASAFAQRGSNQNKENTDVSSISKSGDGKPSAETEEGIVIDTKFEALEAVESVQLHLNSVQRKFDELEQQEKLLKAEKVEHIQAWKRLTNEDSSRFKNRPKLNDRYVLMALLGKGGFSEVWKGYDVEDLKEVAVKIHQLDPRWSDEKKESYTKHVSREYEIHRNVRHGRIVSLLDVFEVDMNSFCTVLEYCDGPDLETILKRRGKLPEREARAILLQILSGMKYLSQPSPDGSRQAIIHYDLKPGNILFSAQGDAFITDFGLSKIVEAHDPGQSMELTSQGAGTYWYLPPECFIMDEDVTVKISNKVDVWSIGVIYYQMLYGRRPFGHGQSQDKILNNSVMLNAKEVVFREEPQVSEAAKAFIRECLQYDSAIRPTIAQICENTYVTTAKF